MVSTLVNRKRKEKKKMHGESARILGGEARQKTKSVLVWSCRQDTGFTFMTSARAFDTAVGRRQRIASFCLSRTYIYFLSDGDSPFSFRQRRILVGSQFHSDRHCRQPMARSHAGKLHSRVQTASVCWHDESERAACAQKNDTKSLCRRRVYCASVFCRKKSKEQRKMLYTKGQAGISLI